MVHSRHALLISIRFIRCMPTEMGNTFHACSFFCHPKQDMFSQKCSDTSRLCASIMQPDIVHLDFKKAVHEVVLNVWPDISVKGCHFHLGQSWYRKIVSFGLDAEYKNPDSELGSWLKRFFGLMFVAPRDVHDTFAFDYLDDMPDDQRCMDFADYMLNTYVGAQSTFPPEAWADPDPSTIRTTNACESFHHHFSDCFHHAHPNIFEMMEKLEDVQANSYAKINTMNARQAGTLPPMRAARRLKLQQMNDLKRQYEQGTISRKDFVKGMAFKNLPPLL